MSVWLNADQVAERIGVSKRTALTLMYQMPHGFRLAWVLDRNGVFVRGDYLPTL